MCLPFVEAIEAQRNTNKYHRYADDSPNNRGSQEFTQHNKDNRQDEADKPPAQAKNEECDLQWQIDRPEEPGYIFTIGYSSHIQLL